VLWPRGSVSRELAELLTEAGHSVLDPIAYETRASEARALQAGKPPNPELDMRLYRLGIPRQSAQPDEARWRVVFRQAFELGAKGRRRFELADTERELADWDYEAKRIEVASDVTVRFLAVLGAQLRRETWGETVEYFEQMRDRVAALVARGAMRKLETHQAKRQLGLAQVEDLFESGVSPVVGIGDLRAGGGEAVEVAEQGKVSGEFGSSALRGEVRQVLAIHREHVVVLREVVEGELPSPALEGDAAARGRLPRSAIRALTDVIGRGPCAVDHDPIGQILIGHQALHHALGRRGAADVAETHEADTSTSENHGSPSVQP